MNPHYANFGDVVKHLLLGALLEELRPARYVESHSGCASYPFEDCCPKPEAYDARCFLELAEGVPELRESAYHRALLEMNGRYPGSPALAMSVLQTDARYLFFNKEEPSACDVEQFAADRGLGEVVESRWGDGLAGVVEDAGEHEGADETLYFIDPFHLRGNSKKAFRELSQKGRRAVLWYPGSDASAASELADKRIELELCKPKKAGLGKARLKRCGLALVHCGPEALGRCEGLAQELATGFDARLI